MDLYAVLADLVAERKRIDELIRTLEAMTIGGSLRDSALRQNRRGRKSMSPEERLEVSRRMQRYWEARRAARCQPADEIAERE